MEFLSRFLNCQDRDLGLASGREAFSPTYSGAICVRVSPDSGGYL
jgi:hypothetical protein